MKAIFDKFRVNLMIIYDYYIINFVKVKDFLKK